MCRYSPLQEHEFSAQTSQLLFSPLDTQCGVEHSFKTDENEFKTDILHFYPEIDFNYWNEEKWPENIFLSHRDSGEVSYSGNTIDHY